MYESNYHGHKEINLAIGIPTHLFITLKSGLVCVLVTVCVCKCCILYGKYSWEFVCGDIKLTFCKFPGNTPCASAGEGK